MKKKIQNKHRKFDKSANDSFSVVFDNINKLKRHNEYYFSRNVKFNAVKFLDEDIQPVYDFFYSKFGKSKDMVNVINADIRGIDYFYSEINIAKNVTDKGFVYDNPDMEYEQFENSYKDKTEMKKEWLYCSNCIPGAQHLLVNVFGKFFPCEKVPEVSATQIGDIDKGFDFEKIDTLLNIHDVASENCKKCWAIRYCNMCICHCIDHTTGEISNEAKEYSCNVTKSEVLKKFKKVLEKAENE